VEKTISDIRFAVNLFSSDIFSGLTCVTGTHAQAELSFYRAQSLDEIYRLSPMNRFTVDRVFALPHQRFQLMRVET
jgi:hypothetical protein